MTNTDTTTVADTDTRTVRVFRVYIKANAEQVWEAITSPEWTRKYGYQTASEYELRPGGAFASHSNEQMLGMGLPDVAVDGEVVEADPPGGWCRPGDSTSCPSTWPKVSPPSPGTSTRKRTASPA